MLLKVDLSQDLFQWLFRYLYKSLLDYENANGQGNEATVKAKLLALLAEDKSCGMLIDLEDMEVKGHCFYSLIPLTQTTTCVLIAQLAGSEFFQREVFTYLESVNTVVRLYFSVNENRAIELKESYEFSLARVEMTREVKRDGTL